jgi:transposase
MPHFSLEEHFRRNITFPEPYLRMVGLEAARIAVEEQLDHLKGQRAVRLYARLEREAHTMASDDIECEIEGLKETVEELFPKVFRSGFVIPPASEWLSPR